jgi:hypothetical protein
MPQLTLNVVQFTTVAQISTMPQNKNTLNLTISEEFTKRQAQIDLEKCDDIEELRAKSLQLLDLFFKQRAATRHSFEIGMQMGASHNSMMHRMVTEGES